jgi:hypothetical protein
MELLTGNVVGMILVFAWVTIYYIQMFLGFGTAYRLTKRGGDSGVALFGWLFVFAFVSGIPGLGIFLWCKYRVRPMAN